MKPAHLTIEYDKYNYNPLEKVSELYERLTKKAEEKGKLRQMVTNLESRLAKNEND